MFAPNPDALKFLQTRRSRPQKTLVDPVPDRQALEPILTAALRSPDHGKLEPWRLIVLHRAALRNLVPHVHAIGQSLGKPQADIEKAALAYETSGLAVAVIESPVASEKVPAIEQSYSAGAVCLALLNAALAAGWGANWLSGWISHDVTFRKDALGLAEHERIAGLIHIGTQSSPPPERPRPDPEKKITWHSE